MNYLNTVLRCLLLMLGLSVSVQGAVNGGANADLAKNFSRPPDSARPWVYWFWLNSNVSPEGITADLEAMRRVGIGGVLLMDVDQGVLAGSVKFMDDAWRELFAHAVREAKRLGLEINANNGPGYFGSGGSWMTPELGIQTVMTSETRVPGGRAWTGVLPQPQSKVDEKQLAYRDVAVIAVAEPELGTAKRYEIDDFSFKALTWVRWVHYRGGQSAPLSATAPEGVAIPLEKVVNLTGRMKPDGTLTWDAPPGDWTILRIGHGWTGSMPGPTAAGQTGPEIDYLNKKAVQFHFDAMVKRLNKAAGDAGPGTLVASHVDSWEGGGQNWTANMPAEFQKRRGYDIAPWLPVLAGRVLGDLQRTERFLWDLRQTVSELMVENYAAEFQRLARENGLRFTMECYTTTGNDLDAANFVDEPMAEFWYPSYGFGPSVKGMASAAQINGRAIVGAEAFTADARERWLAHPANLKSFADTAFSQGANRLVVHRYAAQRFVHVAPGLQMGPWGQHYERTNTWWEWTLPWHTYLSRSQYMLRQGKLVADVLDLQAEEPVRRFKNRTIPGYDYIACGPDTFRKTTVRDGQWVVPSGLSFRLLVLPESETMTVARLKQILEGVRAGGALFGQPPKATPGLTDYPQADAELRRLVEELWGPGQPVPERRVGKGVVFSGQTPAKALASLGVAPDFTANRPLAWNHRRVDGVDIYFIANSSQSATQARATFRVSGKQPELWNPETGEIELPETLQENAGSITIPLRLEPSGSVFVVFRNPLAPSPGQAKITVLSARYGLLDDPQKTLNVTAEVQALVDAGNPVIPVTDITKVNDPAFGSVKTLEVTYSSGGKSATVSAKDSENLTLGTVEQQGTATQAKITVLAARYGLLDDPQKTLDVKADVQALVDAGNSVIQVSDMAQSKDPAFGSVKTLEVTYSSGGKPATVSGKDSESLTLEAVEPEGTVIDGPWEVAFDPKWGGPAKVVFETLEDWSKRPEEGIRYYSGTATYRKTFAFQPSPSKPTVKLDLGKVAVMARVKLNGHDLGILWKPPYRVDITSALKAGVNALEIKVVNLWPNRLIGDEQLPEDSERKTEGNPPSPSTLKSWPQWLLDGQPSPTGRLTFSSWRLWKKDEALQPSGLLGPVTLLDSENNR